MFSAGPGKAGRESQRSMSAPALGLRKVVHARRSSRVMLFREANELAFGSKVFANQATHRPCEAECY